MTKETTVHIPEDIHRELKAQAAREGVSLASFIAMLLRKILGMNKGEQ